VKLFRAGGQGAEDAKLLSELKDLKASIDRAQAVAEYDLDGRILEANGNFLRLFGYTLEEVRGRHHRMLVPPERAQKPAYEESWRTLKSGQVVGGTFPRVAKGGRELWVQASCTPVLDDAGRPYKIVEFAVDLTAEMTSRRKGEAEREEAERQQTAAVAAMGEALGRLARRDLTVRLDPGVMGRHARLAEDFNGAVGVLRGALGSVQAATGGLRNGSEEIAAAADDLSRRIEQQAAGLEETAAALDEITQTVKATADGARKASSMVADAKSEAERSGEVVGQAVEAMGQIEGSSRQISQIIGVIDEIAFQTNLLALNAGVEAARAGDAGKGFAVVASEVRALAQRSADAAKEIKTLISASSQQVEQGVGLVGAAGKALQTIGARVHEIDALVGEIAASAQEQSTGLSQVNATVNQMDQVVQQNAAMVEQATAASHAMQAETEQLSDIVAGFEVGSAEGAHRPAARRPAPAPVAAPARPAASPARALGRRLAVGLGAEPAGGWEEF
jgi:methyl-accepting chemotaxis protein